MILVTGATGLVGSHLLYELSKADKQVRALYRNYNKISFVKKVFSFYDPDFVRLFNRIEWLQVDIKNYNDLLDCMQGTHQVYHTAGLVSFNNKFRKELYDTNITGTANVVNACIESGVKKLCHVSSIATLGDTDSNGSVDENLIWNRGNSASAYAISKYKGEMEVWRGIYEGLDAFIVNPAVIIGPGMWEGPGKHLLKSIYSGLKFYPKGSSAYIDVRDVTRNMILLMESNFSGERIILSSENIPHKRFIDWLAEAMGKSLPQYAISPIIIHIAVVLEYIRAFFSGSIPRISRQSLNIANEQLNYSNVRIQKLLGYKFIPVEESVNFTVPLYLKEVEAGRTAKDTF